MQQFGNNLYIYLRRVVSIIVPTAILALIALTLVKPLTMDWLGGEDNIVEALSAASLFAASLLGLGFAFYVVFRHRQYALSMTLILFSIVAFVVGMEEISWMQRILAVESNEFFLTYNDQMEMNFHNLSTRSFELAYATGAFVLLTLLPFFHRPLHKFFSGKRYVNWITVLLPSTWLFVPFAATAGVSYRHPWVTFLTILTVVLLIHYMARTPRETMGESSLRLPLALLALACAVIGFIVFSYLNYEGLGVRGWAGSEYGELFIAFGILVYLCDIVYRTVAKKNIDLSAPVHKRRRVRP